MAQTLQMMQIQKENSEKRMSEQIKANNEITKAIAEKVIGASKVNSSINLDTKNLSNVGSDDGYMI